MKLRNVIYIGGCSILVLAGCRSPTAHREQADRAATDIVEQTQQELFDRDTPFVIETPSDTLRRRLLLDQDLPTSGKASLGTDELDPIPHWPEDDYPARLESDGLDPAIPPGEPLELSLVQALQVGARNSRDYQSRKEEVFRSALNLDLEEYRFRSTYRGAIESTFTEDRGGEETVRGVETTGTLGASRLLRTGADISGRIMLDLVNLLTLDRASSFGVAADLTVSIPLLRGAGRHIVTEPLTQAERNVLYALYTFENFKRGFSVRIASDYLSVLQQLDQVQNARDNYERLQVSADRARRLAEAGRLPEIQVDQARQEELRARDRWLAAQSAYERQIDGLKITLGLPTDARVVLDPRELRRLVEWIEPDATLPLPETSKEGENTHAVVAEDAESADTLVESGNASPVWTEAEAVRTAFDLRLDFRVAHGRVFDAQRAVTVAADNLRADLNLTGTARAGERRGLGTATSPDARLRPGDGVYTAGLAMDLPWSRWAERVAYRDTFIALERAARAVQELEDQIKLEIREALRNLEQASETMRIQAQAVELARRRVESTELFLQAGRAQIRDVLEAQESLIAAQNALTAAVVAHRVAELGLQRDMGLLEVTDEGLWIEYADGHKEERLD